MYPQVIILGLAWLKKDYKIVDYSLALSAIGLVFSVYHNYTAITAAAGIFCTSLSSCNIEYVSEFGYITIPLMALTAFGLIFSLLIITKKTNGNFPAAKN